MQPRQVDVCSRRSSKLCDEELHSPIFWQLLIYIHLLDPHDLETLVQNAGSHLANAGVDAEEQSTFSAMLLSVAMLLRSRRLVRDGRERLQDGRRVTSASSSLA